MITIETTNSTTDDGPERWDDRPPSGADLDVVDRSRATQLLRCRFGRIHPAV